MLNDICINVLCLLHSVEKLKDEMRHSWTSKGRRESVAEHSWRLAFMVIVCTPYIKQEFDVLKALKLAIIHDIGESVVGDMHYLEIKKSKDTENRRWLSERDAVKSLSSLIDCHGEDLLSLWEEFEKGASFEAKLIRCLDKIEACIQHNEAHTSTWTSEEKNDIKTYFENINSVDLFIKDLKDAVFQETINKLKC